MRTPAQVRDWLKAQAGKKLDFDGHYGAQLNREVSSFGALSGLGGIFNVLISPEEQRLVADLYTGVPRLSFLVPENTTNARGVVSPHAAISYVGRIVANTKVAASAIKCVLTNVVNILALWLAHYCSMKLHHTTRRKSLLKVDKVIPLLGHTPLTAAVAVGLGNFVAIVVEKYRELAVFFANYIKSFHSYILTGGNPNGKL